MSPNRDLSWRKTKPVCRKLNTKEFCFLCLKTTKIKIENQNGINTDHSETQINQPVSLLCVRRHLKLNFTGIVKDTSWDRSDEEFEVDLCSGCENVIRKFSVLFQELEKVQMEMDYQLEKINLCISEGAQSPELVQEYSKKMTSDVETLSQLALIDKIRKEISQKCLKVRIGSYQRVELPRVKIENIPPSSSSFPANEDAIEDPLNGHEVNFSPPLSPSLPTTYKDDEDDLNWDEPHVDSEAKLELQANSKSHVSLTFLRDSTTGKFCCPTCDKTYANKGDAQAHYEKIHLNLNKRWKCDMCNLTLSRNASNIKRHKKDCVKMLQRKMDCEKSRQHFKFQCSTCGKRFAAKLHLQNHQKSVHSKERFACGTCTKTFKSLSTLSDHRRNMHSVVAVRCKYCNTNFRTYKTCRYHQKKCPQRSLLKTEPNSEKQSFSRDETGTFKCPSCTKTYLLSSEVRRHYNSVHLKKKFNCDLCKLAAFSDPYSLAKHKKNCLDTLQQRLKDQELRNSFQFQCQTCSKKFKTRSVLRSHKKVAHANIRRFLCGHCEKSFKTGAQLRVHRDSVHLKKTYSCKYCNKVLSQSGFYKHDKNCRIKNKGVKKGGTGN